MTKTLYDPEVEKRGIEKGKNQERISIAKKLLDVLDNETIALKTGLNVEEIERLR